MSATAAQIAQVVVGARQGQRLQRPADGGGELPHDRAAEEPVAAGDDHSSSWTRSRPANRAKAKPCGIVPAPVAPSVQPTASAWETRSVMASPLRVAVTLDQVTGIGFPVGSRSTALEAVRALLARGEVDLVGSAPCTQAAGPSRETPSIPVPGALPLTRLALYGSWHRTRHPAVERATGPVDVIYVAGMAMPPAPRRWWSPCTISRSCPIPGHSMTRA